MRRRLGLAVVLLGLAAPAIGRAQLKVQPFIGGGAAIPLEGLGEYAGTGWMVQGGVGFPLGISRWTAQFTAQFARVGHDGDSDEATNIPAAFAGVTYSLNAWAAELSIDGGIGVLEHRYDAGATGAPDESDVKPAAALGATVTVPVNRWAWYVQGRVALAEETSFATVGGGLVFNLFPGSRLRR